MIITYDEGALRQECAEVLPEEVEGLILTLEKELDYANRLGKGGIGLAAPQIGILKKIAIVRLGPKVHINLVNAKLIKGYQPTLFPEEGCLSFPGKVENTIRFQEVHIGNNLVEPYQFVASGLVSVVVQHELDHVNQTLFMDHKAPTLPEKLTSKKLGPNDPCPCGKIDAISGKNVKYKKCHGR